MSPTDYSILSRSGQNTVLNLQTAPEALNEANSEHQAQENKSPVDQVVRSYVITDILALLSGLGSACLIALIIDKVFTGHGNLLLTQTFDVKQIISYLFISAGILLWFMNAGHYRMRMPFWLEVQKIAGVLGFAILVDGFLQFTLKQDVSRLLTISSWIFAAFTIIWLRIMVRKTAAKRGTFKIPALLIGSGATAQHTRTAMNSAPEMGYNIVAQIKNIQEELLQVGGSWNNLCAKYNVQHLVIALDGQDFAGTEKIMTKLMRESISFSLSPPLQYFPVTSMVPQYFINHNIMLLTHDHAIKQRLPQMAKRVVDVAVSGIALLLLSPVMLVIAVLIKLDGGSALFGHKRIGREGKIFPCLKFRTMVMGGDEILKQHLQKNPEAAAEWKATQKLQNDPRITRLGRLLRSSSIDELPQLINVLKGDMSLVGPRPIVRDEIAHYNRDIAYYYRVRPGVTGLWQVSGRNDVSYAQRVQMDSWYVRNWSLWNDIAILCKTFPAVLKRSGAY